MNKIITFFVCFAFFFSIFTPMRVVVNGGEALAMLIPTVLIFIFDKMFLRPQSYVLLIVVAIISALGMNGIPYFSGWRVDVIVLSFGYFGLEHYLTKKDPFYAKWVLLTTYITLIGLVAISLPQFIAMPNLTRAMGAAAKDPTIEFEYYWAVSYNTVHLIPTATIPLFASYAFARKRWMKWMFGICIGLMSTIMFFADATTPLILMILIQGFFWIYNTKHALSVNIMKLSVIALMAAVFLNTSIYVMVLKTIQPIFVGSSTYKKIDEMAYYAENGESYGDMEERENLYNVSLDAILRNPLFPETNIDNIGKHSHLLDHMASMGLILFIPYAMFLYNRFRKPLAYLNRYKTYYIVAFASFIILAFAKNSFTFTTAAFLVPMYLIYLENPKVAKIK